MVKQLIIPLMLFHLSSPAQEKEQIRNQKQAIIVLTYDDALTSQLDIAIPQLNAANLKGTFFLDGKVDAQNLNRWRAAAAAKHELANHTLYHPCLDKDGRGKPENNSANYTPATIMREIGMMNTLLTALDHKKTHTYAYPCTETTVGGQSYLDTLKRSGLAKYARIGGDKNSIVTDYNKLDIFQVPSWPAFGEITGTDLISFVKSVQKTGGLGVFMFHGVGGDYLTTPAQAHKELLDYLKAQRKQVSVMTFEQAMNYITSIRNKP
jgi:peptidoglycan/xylan/chitin deacetylase (PgdA/CDA1 family)